MQIKFLYKGKQINWLNDDQKNYKISYNITSIGDYFENDNNPVIFVMDMNNFLSSINVTFKTTYGHCFNLTIRRIRTLDHLLTKYVYEMKHFELVDTNKIGFFYYNKQIIFGDNTTLNEVFLNDNNPLIAVVDANYLLYNNLLNKVNLFFTRCDGRKNCLAVNYGTTVEQAIKMYLYKLGEEESIDSYYSKNNYLRFKFLYNACNIKGKQINVELFFNNPSPNITVISD